jgi:hypothetical protein
MRPSQIILVLIVIAMIVDLIAMFRRLLIDMKHGRDIQRAVWHTNDTTFSGQESYLFLLSVQCWAARQWV